MSPLGSRSLRFVVLGLLPACTTYSSLDAEMFSGQMNEAGTGASSSAGTVSGASGSGGASGGRDSAVEGGETGMAGGIPNAGAGGTGASGSSGSGGDRGGSAAKPIGLSLADTTTDLVHELDPDGTLYSERCPEQQVVIGFHGTVDAPGGKSYIRSVQAVCGELSVSANEPYAVTVTPADTLPMHDIASAQMQTALCPENQVMTGFAGRSGLWMDSVDVRCAPLTILGTSPSFLLVVGTAGKAGTVGGTTGGSPFEPLECAPGDVAVGQIVRTIHAGVVVGAFGVLCSTLMLELGSD